MKTLKQLPYYGLMALLVYMPFHIFLSQSLSLVTGGLDAWKAAKDILLLVLTAAAVGIVCWQRRKNNDFKKLVVIAVAYGLVHLFAWAINRDIYQETAIQGIVYNNRILLFAVLGMAAAVLSAKSVTEKKLIKITLIVSTVVCILGILQYFLPKDLLTHVGYSVERGVKPAFFIDDKPDFPRIMSTLRDPNSLGAFVILPLCLLYGLFMKYKSEAAKRNKLLLIGALHVLALLLTFSRGAWAGAFIALISCLVFFRTGKLRFGRRGLFVAASVVVVLCGLIFALRDQRTVQNIIQHSDETTAAPQDSNALHLDFAADSLRAGLKKPLGHGPGTAGIVSIRNPNGGQLTENYYLQILYEAGVIGLGIFIYALLFVGRKVRASQTLLGNALFASLIAYLCMAMLMHIWSNEAVAAQWWLLAGACLGLVPLRDARRKAVD